MGLWIPLSRFLQISHHSFTRKCIPCTETGGLLCWVTDCFMPLVSTFNTLRPCYSQLGQIKSGCYWCLITWKVNWVVLHWVLANMWKFDKADGLHWAMHPNKPNVTYLQSDLNYPTFKLWCYIGYLHWSYQKISIPCWTWTDSVDHLIWMHDDVMTWKPILLYWPFVRGIHWLPVDSPHKGPVILTLDDFLVVSFNTLCDKQTCCDLRYLSTHMTSL